MKIAKALAVIALSTINIVSFSQTNVIEKYLPSDARSVVKINVASIALKIKWADVKNYKIFSDLTKNFPSGDNNYLSNPMESGINLLSGIYMVTPSTTNGERLDPIFYAQVSDTSKISAMVKKLFPGKHPVKVGGSKMIVDKHTSLMWNHEVVILTGDDEQKKKHPNLKAGTPDDLARLKRLSDRTKSLGVAHAPKNDANFTAWQQEIGDLLIWGRNQNATQGKGKRDMALGALNRSFLKRGENTSMVIDFDNGRITGKVKQFPSVANDSLLEQFPRKNINPGLARKLPPGNLILLANYSVSPELFIELLKDPHTANIMDSLGQKEQIFKNALRSLNGDFMLAVLKTDNVSDDDSVTRSMGGIQLFLAGTIRDKNLFPNLDSLLASRKNDSSAKASVKNKKPFVFSNDSVFVISVSAASAKKYIDDNGSNDQFEKLIDPFRDNPAVSIIDLHTVFALGGPIFSKGKSDEEKQQTAALLGMFDKLEIYGGKLEQHVIHNNFEITFTNKDENSLQQFLNLLEVVYSLKNKKSTAYNEPK